MIERGGPYLVASADDSLLEAVTSIAEQFGATHKARTVAAAECCLRANPTLGGLLIDAVLADGSGLSLLAGARAQHRSTPALVVAARADPLEIEAAYDLEARYLLKPVAGVRIVHFLRNGRAFPSVSASPPTPGLKATVERWKRVYRLSEAEADVLQRSARGENRDLIAAERVSSPLTVKKQVANLLQKTTDDTLHDAVARLLRETLPA